MARAFALTFIMTACARTYLLFLVMIACATICIGQPVTGVWRGKVVKGSGLLKQVYKVEVKLIKNGDSITGTSYYYASANNYFRYSVKGYFGTVDNTINWWDDQLIESHSPEWKLSNTNSQPLLSVADYNCPGSGVMLLDGHTQPKEGGSQYDLHLQKMEKPGFKDEWDPVIETYFDGGADPNIIDSVGQIAFLKPTVIPAKSMPNKPQQQTTVYEPTQTENKPILSPKKSADEQPDIARAAGPEMVENPWKNEEVKKPEMVVAKEEKPVTATPAPKPQNEISVFPPVKEARPEVRMALPTVEEKFARRKTNFTTTIPVVGDTVEFKFYDNAEVDGDSISIFLNSKMLYTHIRLTDKGYSIKIAVAGLQAANNELVMVAENLGSIPPNTAYMEAWSGGKRYTARMESTEGSSAMIKLKRE